MGDAYRGKRQGLCGHRVAISSVRAEVRCRFDCGVTWILGLRSRSFGWCWPLHRCCMRLSRTSKSFLTSSIPTTLTMDSSRLPGSRTRNAMWELGAVKCSCYRRPQNYRTLEYLMRPSMVLKDRVCGSWATTLQLRKGKDSKA